MKYEIEYVPRPAQATGYPSWMRWTVYRVTDEGVPELDEAFGTKRDAKAYIAAKLEGGESETPDAQAVRLHSDEGVRLGLITSRTEKHFSILLFDPVDKLRLIRLPIQDEKHAAPRDEIVTRRLIKAMRAGVDKYGAFRAAEVALLRAEREWS